jgi:hypothetical protein
MLDRFLEEINEVVNEIVKYFDEEYSAYLSDEFSADIVNDKVAYSLLVEPISNEEFRNDFVSRFVVADKYSDFLLSLLHEIGHLETVNDMIDDIEKRGKITDNEKYFNLFNERIATDWAGFWLEDNEVLAKRFDAQIEERLFNLYSQISA